MQAQALIVIKTALYFTLLTVATPSSLRIVAASIKRAAAHHQLGDAEFRKGCFHDAIINSGATQNTNRFRLQEAARVRTSPSPSPSPCLFPMYQKRRLSRIENPRCRRNPSLELVADGCHIDQFDPLVMLRLLNNRTLYLIGDSLTDQMASTLAECLMASFLTSFGPWLDDPDGRARAANKPDRRDKGEYWRSYSPDFERIQEVPDELDEGCRLFFKANCTGFSDGTHTTRVCKVPQLMAIYPLEKQYAACWKKMKETDIALVNFGVHANNPDHIVAGIQNFVRFVKNSRSSGSEVSDDSDKKSFRHPNAS